jgi:hypothetical protein
MGDEFGNMLEQVTVEYSRHCSRTAVFLEELRKMMNNFSQDDRNSNLVPPKCEQTRKVCANPLDNIFYFVVAQAV